MKRAICVVAVLFLFDVAVFAQQGSGESGGLTALGGGRVSQRAYTRILYTVRGAGEYPGEFMIAYGQPGWRPEYSDPTTFDQMTNGRVWRMGDNFWTVLDTNLPLKISGKEIGAGSYYLGAHRSEDGSAWSLAFMDPEKVRGARLDAAEIGKAPVDFMVPMTFQTTSEAVEKLIITLEQAKGDLMNATLKVAWGSFQLSAPIEVGGLKP